MTTSPRDEAGFTLIELLIALLVVSLGVVAMLGALGVGISSGSLQRDMARNEGDLIDLGESVKQIPYIDCAEPADYDDPLAPGEVVEVTYWDGVIGATHSFVEDCPVIEAEEPDGEDVPDDQGLQRILVTIVGSGTTPDYELLILKRRP